MTKKNNAPNMESATQMFKKIVTSKSRKVKYGKEISQPLCLKEKHLKFYGREKQRALGEFT